MREAEPVGRGDRGALDLIAGATTTSDRVRPATVHRGAAMDVVRCCSSLSAAELNVVMALPYPVDERTFWLTLGAVGITRSGLMDALGASP